MQTDHTKRLVFLTGVTGHSGQYAIERLAKRAGELENIRFRALVRSTSDVSRIQNSGLPIELVTGDVTDEQTLRASMTGVDTLLHIVGIRQSPLVMRVAAEVGVRRAILVHTTGIYSKYKAASGDYIAIDSEVTAIAARAGIALTILRPTMIYGGTDDQNVITFIRMMDRLPVMPVVGGARYALQPVHRRDLGHAYADVLLAEQETLGKSYVLSGGAPITLREMLVTIAGYLHKQPRFLSVPFWFAFAGAWAVYVLTLTKLDYREKVQRLVEPRAYPHDEAARDFGFTPVAFSEGVRGEVEAYLALREGSHAR